MSQRKILLINGLGMFDTHTPAEEDISEDPLH